MKKIRIGIIFGGRSGEHEISIRSANTVIREINKDKYQVVPIAISSEGNWLNPVESVELLPMETQEILSEDVSLYPKNKIALLGDTGYHGLTRLERSEDEERVVHLDVVFPVLHGTYGEDGTIQGLLEMAGIPYVGCGVLASSTGMDKVVMKTLFRDADLPQCDYVWFLRSEWEENQNLAISQVETKLGYPCFVKPANLGSSVGVTKATDSESLRKGIEHASEYDRKIIVEEHLDMREIECAVMGNNNPVASLPGEYIVHDDNKKFLDYEEKYSGTGNNDFVVPALVSPELTKKIQGMSLDAYRALDGAGFARADFFLRSDTGALLINEVNTIPGLTEASGFPKMWEGSGRDFSSVIDSLVDSAFERHEDKLRNKTKL